MNIQNRSVFASYEGPARSQLRLESCRAQIQKWTTAATMNRYSAGISIAKHEPR